MFPLASSFIFTTSNDTGTPLKKWPEISNGIESWMNLSSTITRWLRLDAIIQNWISNSQSFRDIQKLGFDNCISKGSFCFVSFGTWQPLTGGREFPTHLNPEWNCLRQTVLIGATVQDWISNSQLFRNTQKVSFDNCEAQNVFLPDWLLLLVSSDSRQLKLGIPWEKWTRISNVFESWMKLSSPARSATWSTWCNHSELNFEFTISLGHSQSWLRQLQSVSFWLTASFGFVSFGTWQLLIGIQ